MSTNITVVLIRIPVNVDPLAIRGILLAWDEFPQPQASRGRLLVEVILRKLEYPLLRSGQYCNE